MHPIAMYDNHRSPPPRTASLNTQPQQAKQAVAAPASSSSRATSPATTSGGTGERDSFDFPVPIPPRLANFGRRISQMRDDFMDNLDGNVDARRSSQETTRPHVDVPGMGEEPVMCPFCDKPLPPALFAQHNHKKPMSKSTTSTKPTRPPMRARPATSIGSPRIIGVGFFTWYAEEQHSGSSGQTRVFEQVDGITASTHTEIRQE